MTRGKKKHAKHTKETLKQNLNLHCNPEQEYIRIWAAKLHFLLPKTLEAGYIGE